MIRARSSSSRALALAALVCGSVCAGPSGVRAESDVQLWMNAELQYRVSDARVGFAQHLRLEDDITRVRTAISEVYGAYDVVDFLRFYLGYRLQFEHTQSGDYEIRHRIEVATRLAFSIAWLDVVYRLMFVEELEMDRGMGLLKEHVLRNLVAFEVDTDTRTTPFAETELFLELAGPDGTRVQKMWFTFGILYGFSRNDFEFFYRYELPIEDDRDPALHIFGLGYRRAFRREPPEDEAATDEGTPAEETIEDVTVPGETGEPPPQIEEPLPEGEPQPDSV